MAASTSLSVSKSFYTLLPSPSSSSSSSKTLCFDSHFLVTCNNNNNRLKPILPAKGKRFSHTFFKLHPPILSKYGRQERGFFLNASSSDPPSDSSPQDIGGPDGYQNELVSDNEAGQSTSFSLMSILQVYKDAVLIGDVKTISEVEAMICMVEKEKNQLVEKVSVMSAEINSGKEKCIRLQADFDNFRKRSEKERLTVRSNAQGEIIESLLPMVDNFERAKQQLKLETEKEKKIDASYQGIYKQFVEIMKSLHVAAVPTVGKPFDPLLHEAIAREESQEFKEGIVIQEFRRGFRLGDRLLRPAMVKVSSGPGKRKDTAVAKKSSEQSAAVAGVDER